jgi:molybdenum cofactor synthesis domain-containing protein
MRAVVITVSTRAAQRVYADEAGPAVAEALRSAGIDVADVVVVPDEHAEVAGAIVAGCEGTDLVVTNGGTGLHPRDVTPEATLAVVERVVPGLAEAMRAASLALTPMAMLSRATAGVRGRTLIVNLPGSPKAAVENLRTILPVLAHAVDQLHGGDHPR